jgi:hypothetical protein
MLHLRWLIVPLAVTAVGCTSENGLSPAPPPACYDLTALTGQDVCHLLGDACNPASGAPPSFTDPITNDPKKYDSALVFIHEGEVYLIGRRRLVNDGHVGLGLDGDPSDLALEYQAEYRDTPKRCALWRVDPETLTVALILDPPSAGDTCFASALALAGDPYLVYNDSSSFEPGDLAWNEGQFGETFI